jgi:hypothetical protein
MSNVNRLTKAERKAIKDLRTSRKGGKRVVWDSIEYDETLSAKHNQSSGIYYKSDFNVLGFVRSDLSAYN